MSDYSPDKWVVLEVNNGKSPIFHKVFASWSGGYLSSDSWRLNSGVSKIKQDNDFFYVYSESGSCYKLHKEMYGVAGLYNYGIIDSIKEKFGDKIKILDNYPEEWILSEENSNTTR